jgi:hypothetical protein
MAAHLKLEWRMKSTKWMFACALGILMLTGNFTLVQGHGKGQGKGEACELLFRQPHVGGFYSPVAMTELFVAKNFCPPRTPVLP